MENTAPTTLGDDTRRLVEVDKVQANIFFDGTRNNYYNVNKADESIRSKHGGEDTSYANALSNVARMWEPIGEERDGPDIAVYIQGMGTTKFQADSTLGYALGEGETGIRQRAQDAFAPLKELVKKKSRKKGLPAILELNVFGFSRGAATARHFLCLLCDKQERQKYFSGTWAKVVLQVNFVGLFDTVSSEGVYYGNDVVDLGLRIQQETSTSLPSFYDDVALRVFHLYALDEYRENFSCTTIESARRAKTDVNGKRVCLGFEFGIPGAHSDVGGGYTTDVGKPTEERLNLSKSQLVSRGRGQYVTLPGIQDFVYSQGWFGSNERLDASSNSDTHMREVRGDYYRVGLSLMVDMAEAYTTARYSDKVKVTSQEPDIANLQSNLRAILKANGFVEGKPRLLESPLTAEIGESAAKKFRRKYLHLSVNVDKTGMGPRFKDATTLERHYEPG